MTGARSQGPRVALVMLATEPGGTWKHVTDLATGLISAGIDVVVCVPTSAVVLRDDLRHRGIAIGDLRRELIRRRCVLHLHLHNTLSPVATALLLARRPFGPAVITEHLPRTDATDPSLTPDARSPGAAIAKKLFKRLQFRFVDQVIAVSGGSARFLADRYGTTEAKVTVIRHGLQLLPGGRSERSRWPRSAVAPDPLRVIAVGSLIRQKGFDVLVDSTRHAHTDWTVSVFGVGPQLEPLRERACAVAESAPDGRKVDSRIELGGWTDDVRRHLAEADVLVMPSRWESAGYAAMEGMADGLPVVASAVDGLAEIVLDGQTGVLVPPGDPAALAEALDRLAGDRELLRAMGRAGRERAHSAFPMHAMVEATTRVYARVWAQIAR